MASNFGKTNLDNGIRIITERIPYARSVSMGVWVNVGARDELLEENGLSHFIEHMIFKGTRKRTAIDIAKEFDAIGGQCNAFTSKENTCYHAKVMDTHLHTMVDLLSDIFLNSVFDPEEMERERQVILQEIRMLEDTPDELVHVLMSKAVWGDHPLGRSILGIPETVMSFDSDKVERYLKRAYQPDRIVIAAAGNLEHSLFTDMVASSFEAVRRMNDFPERQRPIIHHKASAYRKDLEQVHICIGAKGVPAVDARRYDSAVLNVILGGNMSSRLFQEIRERRGLAYAVYSFLSSYSDTGRWGAYVGVDRSNVDEAIDILLKQLRTIKKEPVGSSELANAKEYLKGGLYLSAESTENQMTRIAQNEINFGRYISLKEVEEEVENVTAERLTSLAQDVFVDEALSLTLLGPVDETISYQERFRIGEL